MTVHSTVSLYIWWNMLIKFNKQIGNNVARTIKRSEMEHFESTCWKKIIHRITI